MESELLHLDSKRAQTYSYTGQKLAYLETVAIKDFARAIHTGKFSNFTEYEINAFQSIRQALVDKTSDAQNQISGAAYASILLYNVSRDIKIHAGANIDPHHRDLFDSTEHRNCAEKQASISAAADKLSSSELDLIFLYRSPQEDKMHSPEMLVPCSHCAIDYLHDLQSNNGHLVLILPDDSEREFLVESNPFHDDNKVLSVSDREQKKQIYYRIFNAKELDYLKIEKNLGHKVKHNNGVKEIIDFAALKDFC